MNIDSNTNLTDYDEENLWQVSNCQRPYGDDDGRELNFG